MLQFGPGFFRVKRAIYAVEKMNKGIRKISLLTLFVSLQSLVDISPYVIVKCLVSNYGLAYMGTKLSSDGQWGR